MSFYICHCGNTQDNHYFRHAFEKCCLVVCEKHNDIENFILNADNYPVKTGEKCSIPNCTGKINIHETILLNHKYIPISYNYREIKFSIPKDAKCHYKNCKKLSEHSNVMTHHFTTKVTILNKKDNDIVSLFDKDDEDIKILNS